MRRRNESDSAHGMRIGAPEGQARQAHSELRAAVQAVLERQELISSRVERRQQGRSFVRLAAAAAEERSADPARKHGGELLGQIHNRLGQVDGRRMLQRSDLLADRLDKLRMAMAQRMHADAGVEVQVSLA